MVCQVLMPLSQQRKEYGTSMQTTKGTATQCRSRSKGKNQNHVWQQTLSARLNAAFAAKERITVALATPTR